MCKVIAKLTLIAALLTSEALLAEQIDDEKGSKSWQSALSQCTPGVLLDDCVRAFEGTTVTPQRLDHRQAERNLYLDLDGPIRLLKIAALQSANWKITSVSFIGDFYDKYDRRKLLTWVQSQIPHPPFGPCIDCGCDYSGPSWRLRSDRLDEVALSLDGCLDLRAGRGKDLEKYFVNQVRGGAVVCFHLPKNFHGYFEQSNAAGIMQAFIQSEFFAGKVTPKKPPQ